MSRTSRATKGFVTSIFQTTMQILVQALLAPIVLRMAGRETLGAYSAVMQVLSFIAITDFMGAWVLERFLAQATGLEDGGQRFRTVFTTVRTVILFCATAYALLVFIFSFLVARMFHLSPYVGHQAQYALWVIAAWVILRMPFAAYQNASYATQDMAAANLIGTCTLIGRTLGSLVFVLLGGGLFGLMLAGTLVEGIGYVFYRMRFKRMNPTLMPSWGVPDKALLKEMMGFGGHNVVMNLGNSLLFSSGNMIAGLTKGPEMASTFYTTQMPAMTAYNMLMRLPDSAMPAINELWGKGEVEKVRNSFYRLTRIVLALTLPLATGVLLFNRDLVTVWVGPRQYGGELLTASLAAFCVVVSIQRMAVTYSYSFGWMRLLTATSLAQGIANFALGYILARRIGMGGITLALVIVVLPQTVILWRRLGIFFETNVVVLLARCLSALAIPLICAAAGSFLVHRSIVIKKHDFIGLFAEAMTFIAVYAALAYRFGLIDHDRNEVRRYLGSTLGRGKRVPKRLARAFGFISN